MGGDATIADCGGGGVLRAKLQVYSEVNTPTQALLSAKLRAAQMQMQVHVIVMVIELGSRKEGLARSKYRGPK